MSVAPNLEARRISIALAAYNGAGFIGEQLQSYVEQTLLPMELVVTDDGSTDGTLDIVEAFARTAPFAVRIHRNPQRLGFRDNFLRAASLCEGDYIAYSDQDDWWDPRKLETAMGRIVQDGSLLAIHTSHVGDENLNVKGRLGQGISGDRVLDSLSMLPLPGGSYGFTLLFKRSILEIVDPKFRPPQPQEPGTVVYHDLWAYVLATVFGKISEIDEPLSIYRQHSGMTSSGAIQNYEGGRNVPLWHYEFRRKFALDIAEALEAALPTIEARYRAKAEAGTAHYRKVAQRYGARLNLYRRRNPFTRAAAFAGMLAGGVYAPPAKGGLGDKAMLKDLVLGGLSLGRPLEQG